VKKISPLLFSMIVINKDTGICYSLPTSLYYPTSLGEEACEPCTSLHSREGIRTIQYNTSPPPSHPSSAPLPSSKKISIIEVNKSLRLKSSLQNDSAAIVCCLRLSSCLLGFFGGGEVTFSSEVTSPPRCPYLDCLLYRIFSFALPHDPRGYRTIIRTDGGQGNKRLSYILYVCTPWLY